MSTPPTAVYDAWVLLPATLRDILMQFAWGGLVRAHWTDRIHEEWIAALLRMRPEIQRAALDERRRAMDDAVPGCLVTDYESRIDAVTLPDPDDRHVVAAAIQCEASVIVTTNLRDFPSGVLAPFGLRAQHPDDFIVDRIDGDVEAACAGIRLMRLRWKRPAYEARGMLELFRVQGLARTSIRLEPLVNRL